MNPGIFKLPLVTALVAVAASGAWGGQYAGFDLQTVVPSITMAEHSSPTFDSNADKRASLYDPQLTRSSFSDFLMQQGIDYVMPAGVIAQDKSVSIGLSERPVSEVIAIVAEAFGAAAELRSNVWYFKNRHVVLTYSETVAPISSQLAAPRDRRLDPLIDSLTEAQVTRAGRLGYLTFKELSIKQRALLPKHLIPASKAATDAKIRLPKDSLPVFK